MEEVNSEVLQSLLKRKNDDPNVHAKFGKSSMRKEEIKKPKSKKNKEMKD